MKEAGCFLIVKVLSHSNREPDIPVRVYIVLHGHLPGRGFCRRVIIALRLYTGAGLCKDVP